MSYLTYQWVKMNPDEALIKLAELEKENERLKRQKSILMETIGSISVYTSSQNIEEMALDAINKVEAMTT